MARQVVLSPEEETSILLDGDFDQDSYSKNLKISFFKSLAMVTKLPDEIKFMPGMSGKKYRYLINNFVSLTKDSRYLEIGTWTGSTVCAALYGNNWLKFNTEEILKKFYNTKNQKKTLRKISVK